MKLLTVSIAQQKLGVNYMSLFVKRVLSLYSRTVATRRTPRGRNIVSILDGTPNDPYIGVKVDRFEAKESHVRKAIKGINKRRSSSLPKAIASWFWPVQFKACMTVNGRNIIVSCRIIVRSEGDESAEYCLAISGRHLSYLAPEFWVEHSRCHVVGVAMRDGGSAASGHIHLPPKLIVSAGYLNTLTVFGALCR